MSEDNWCCFIDPETKAACRADAEWLIVTGFSPDDQIEACTAHVGYLLVDEPFNHIFLIERG